MARHFIFLMLYVFLWQKVDSCDLERNLVIMIDSTSGTNPGDFGSQKSFIEILLNEINKTKIRLTAQVYSDEETCSKFVGGDVRTTIINETNFDQIRSKLVILKYEQSSIDFNLNCVQNLVRNTIINSNSFALVLAKSQSVKTQLSKNDDSASTIPDNELVCLFYSYGHETFRTIQLNNIQTSALEVQRLLCDDSSIENQNSSPIVESSQRPTFDLSSYYKLPEQSIVGIKTSTVKHMQPSSTVLPRVNGAALSASKIYASTQEPIKNIDKTTSLRPNIQPTSSIDVDETLKTSILPDTVVRVNAASSLNSTLSIQKLQTTSIEIEGKPTLSFINKTITQIQEIVQPSTTQIKDDKVSSHATYVDIFPTNTTAILKPSSSQPDIQSTVHSVQSSTLSIEPSKLLSPSNETSMEIPHIPSSVIEPDNINHTRIIQSSSFAESIDVSSDSNVSIEKSSYSSILNISPSISISKSIDVNTSVALDIKPSVSLKQNQSTIPTNSSLIESMQVESVQPSQSLISSFSMTLVEDGSTSFEHTMVIQSSSITSLAINKSVRTSPSIGTSVRSSDIDFSNVSSILPSLSSINGSFSEVGSIGKTLLSNQSSILTSFLFEAVNSSLMLESVASTAISSNSSMVIETQSQTVQSKFNSETKSFSKMYSTSVIEFSELSSISAVSSGLGEIVSTLITSLVSFNQSISTNVEFSITSKTVSSFKPSSTLSFDTDMMSPESVLPSFASIPLSVTNWQTQALLLPTTTVSKGYSPSLQSSVASISSNFDKALVITTESLTVSPSSTINIYANTSIAVVPVQPPKQITKDMEEFLHQDISKEDFANETWVQNFISRSSNLWMKIQTDNSTEVMNGSLPLVEYLESVFTNVAKETKYAKRFTSDRIMVEVSTIKRGEFKEYSFHGMSETDKKEWKEREGLYLPSNFFQQSKDEEFSIMVMEYQPLPVMNAASMDDFQVTDKVYTINVDPPLRAPFQTPFEYVINTKAQKLYDAKCVYWGENSWRTDGCLTYLTNTSMVICKCNHMTPFSVLMQVEKYEIPADHRFALSLITYVGCGMSVAACLILILSFMMCGQLVKVDRNLIHINLATAIALSNALFIAADSVYKYKYVCLGVSIAMLYTFLSSFFWMLVEGLHVYLMVVKVFKGSRKMKVYMLIGWMLPAVIVTLAGVKYHEHFTRPNFCWISTEHFLIWIFVGPALFVLTINTIILIATLSASHKMCINEMEFNKLRRVARLTLLLMPVFGLSWVFGVLAVNKELLIFQYIFTGLNSFQGVFLFVCYCLMNNDVRREYERIRRKSAYSSKSNGLADSAFSTYIHYQNNKPTRTSNRSSLLSSEDMPTTVLLTRYEHPAINEEDFNGSYAGSVSNTLTKRNKKRYSIELVKLPNSALAGEDSTYPAINMTDGVHLLAVDDKASEIYRSSTFSDRSSRPERSTSADDLLEGNAYKTFQNKEDGTCLLAYQV